MKRITKIEAAGIKKDKLRVAAYARVSTDSDEQLISLETQKNHYERYIKARKDWEYAGIYYDEGISGTKLTKRDGLKKLLDDCEKGLIDYIIVKSISRFSRNTVDSIEIVRKLCMDGIYIYFEKENIDTGKMEGELLLSILSSLAESESRSISENETWGIQKRYMNGTFKIGYPPYGYKNVDGKMIVDPEKAEIVRFIFESVLSGMSSSSVAKELNKKGIPSKRGGRWEGHVINGMIKNEKYTGDAIFQKTYTDDRFISRVLKKSSGIDCPARTIREEVLQAAVVTAVNDAWSMKDAILPELRENVRSVLEEDTDKKLTSIDEAIKQKQAKLLEAGRDQTKIDEIGDAIMKLREERQQIMTTAAMRKDVQDRIDDLSVFLDEQTEAITEYSEDLVRRLIEKITVFDEMLVIEFKSGLEIQVEA
jgi:DNA invertase Pin-like site-specific DNA recombinase